MRLAILLVFGAFLALRSWAEIPPGIIADYNAALQSGDAGAQQKAAAGLTSAAMSDPADPQATLLAYEGAWTLCRTGDCKAAIAPAEFALSQPPTDAHPLMADRELLAALAVWMNDRNRRTRKRFDTVLAQHVDAPPSTVSVSAFNLRYEADLVAGDWGQLEASAGDAARHFEQVSEQLPESWINARFATIVADYTNGPNGNAQEDMVRLEGELYQMVYGSAQAQAGEEPVAWLKDSYWRASAWRYAMNAYFASIDTSRTGSRLGGDKGLDEKRVDEILASYTDAVDVKPSMTDTPGVAEDLPFCEGELVQSPSLRYPSRAGFSGHIGAVIAGYRFEDGQVVDVEVLASVPFDGFRDEVVKTVSRWRWKKAENQPSEPCRMSRDNIIQTFVFQL